MKLIRYVMWMKLFNKFCLTSSFFLTSSPCILAIKATSGLVSIWTSGELPLIASTHRSLPKTNKHRITNTLHPQFIVQTQSCFRKAEGLFLKLRHLKRNVNKDIKFENWTKTRKKRFSSGFLQLQLYMLIILPSTLFPIEYKYVLSGKYLVKLCNTFVIWW